MIKHSFLVLTSILVVTACSESPDIVGVWGCSTHNPNGTVTEAVQQFDKNGKYQNMEGDIVLTGIYQKENNDVLITVQTATKGNITVNNTNALVRMDIKTLSKDNLTFDSTIVKSGNKSLNVCTRK